MRVGIEGELSFFLNGLFGQAVDGGRGVVFHIFQSLHTAVAYFRGGLANCGAGVDTAV